MVGTKAREEKNLTKNTYKKKLFHPIESGVSVWAAFAKIEKEISMQMQYRMKLY